MVKPLVTVIMPVHNGSAYLRRTLQSVADQGGNDAALIILDSSDDPMEGPAIIERFAGKLSVEYSHSFQLKRWQSKVNAGIARARTTHVAILHQDDLWLPGHLQSIREAVHSFPEAVLSIGPSRFIDDSDREIGTWRVPYRPGLLAGRAFAEKLVVQNTIAVPSVIYRKDAWLSAGGMDEALWYTPDWDIYLKLAATGGIHIRDRPTTAFRLHGASLTVSGSADAAAFQDQLTTVLDRHLAAWDIGPGSAIARRARASVQMNCALARVMHGDRAAVFQALAAVSRALAAGFPAFLDETRLLDRVLPRLSLLKQSRSPAA